VNSNPALDDKLAALSFEDGTVLDHVMRSDATRERALLETKCAAPNLPLLLILVPNLSSY
jgi:hypothetical protein